MTKEDMKKKIDSLEEEEREILRGLLNVKKDKDLDLIDAVLKIEKRIGDLEDLTKQSKILADKKKSFFETLFE